jgi:hypothetical protein
MEAKALKVAVIILGIIRTLLAARHMNKVETEAACT